MNDLANTIPLGKARYKLALLWLPGAGIIFGTQSSLGDIYEGRLTEVWSWALPALLPTISLILSVLGANAIEETDGSNADSPVLKRSFYKIALGLSVFYLLLILATILLQPIAVSNTSKEKFFAVDFLKQSQLWLSPIQGLVISALGVLFFSKKKPETSQDSENKQPAEREKDRETG